MAEQQAPMKTYRGNCHCAAFVYEITVPEIKELSECNCSVCYKKAALWAFPKPGDVKFVKGDPSALTDYNFNLNKFTHKFCPTCGVSLMVVGHLTPPKAGEDKLPENGINVRTLQHGQINVWEIEKKPFDGRSIPSVHDPPKFAGSEPTAEVEDGQLYTGGCHCGAVRVALKSKPIDKDARVVECNCSSCGKYGATWIYPQHAQCSTEGSENLQEYIFGKRVAAKMFCKICGVPVFSLPTKLTEEQIAALDEGARKWIEMSKGMRACNLRLLDGLDVKDLNPTKFDGYNTIKPGYVEP